MDHNETGCECAACKANDMIKTIGEIIEAIECDCPVCETIKEELIFSKSALSSLLAAVAVMYPDPDPDPRRVEAIEAHFMGINISMASTINSFARIRDAAHQAFDVVFQGALQQVANQLKKQGFDAVLATLGPDGNFVPISDSENWN